ncbi:hypothetical protein PCE1_000830 [Barthelona sp. PCE]
MEGVEESPTGEHISGIKETLSSFLNENTCNDDFSNYPDLLMESQAILSDLLTPRSLVLRDIVELSEYEFDLQQKLISLRNRRKNFSCNFETLQRQLTRIKTNSKAEPVDLDEMMMKKQRLNVIKGEMDRYKDRKSILDEKNTELKQINASNKQIVGHCTRLAEYNDKLNVAPERTPRGYETLPFALQNIFLSLGHNKSYMTSVTKDKILIIEGKNISLFIQEAKPDPFLSKGVEFQCLVDMKLPLHSIIIRDQHIGFVDKRYKAYNWLTELTKFGQHCSFSISDVLKQLELRINLIQFIAVVEKNSGVLRPNEFRQIFSKGFMMDEIEFSLVEHSVNEESFKLTFLYNMRQSGYKKCLFDLIFPLDNIKNPKLKYLTIQKFDNRRQNLFARGINAFDMVISKYGATMQPHTIMHYALALAMVTDTHEHIKTYDGLAVLQGPDMLPPLYYSCERNHLMHWLE